MQKKTFILLVCFIVFLFCCKKTGNENKSLLPLENVLTRVLSFGADKTALPKEYLLSFPLSISVDENQNIYVLDENRIKVYDQNGKPFSIIGGPGQNPGEFENPENMTMSKSGYISVTGYNSNSVFNKEHRFLYRRTMRGKRFISEYVRRNNYYSANYLKSYAVNDSTQITQYIFFTAPKNDILYFPHLLVYETPDTTCELLSQEIKLSVVMDNSLAPIPNQPPLIWAILGDNVVVYTDPLKNMPQIGSDCQYYLYLFSPDNFQKKEIRHPYSPAAIPDSIKQNYWKRYAKQFELYPPSEKVKSKTAEILGELKYEPIIEDIFTDLDRIFVFTSAINKKDEILTDIFNADTGQYIQSAYFPVYPFIIKDGYLYTAGKNKDNYHVIEKYKIDPKVYGK